MMEQEDDTGFSDGANLFTNILVLGLLDEAWGGSGGMFLIFIPTSGRTGMILLILVLFELLLSGGERGVSGDDLDGNFLASDR